MANYGGLQPWGGGPQSGMRASDAERERAVDVLKAGFAEGRLSREEYERRVERAYRAGTYGELAALVGDLPQGPALPVQPVSYGPPMPMTSPSYLPVPPRPTDGMAVAALMCGLAGVILAVPSVPAIVLGHIAKNRVRRSGEGGDAAATAGAVLGYLSLTFWVFVLVVTRSH